MVTLTSSLKIKQSAAVVVLSSSQHMGTNRRVLVGGAHEYLLQGPALASLQKSTPLFLSKFSDRPGGRG